MSSHAKRLERQDEAVAAAFDRRLTARLWSFVRPHLRLILAGLGLLFVVSACRLGLPYLVKLAIDRNLIAGTLDGFFVLVAAYLLLAAVEYGARRLQIYTVDKAGQNALYDLRIALFRHLQSLPSRFFDQTPTGRLVGRVTTDIEALQELFSSGVVTILGDLIFLAAVLSILFSANVTLTLVCLAVVPVLLGITLFIRVRVRRAYVRMRSLLSRLNAYLHEQISGMPVVQMFGHERASADEFGEINAGVRDAQVVAVTWESALSATTEMLNHFTLALILWFGSAIVLGESPSTALGTGLSLGTLFFFIDYMGKFFQPLNDLSLKYTVMQNAMTASDRIFALFDAGGQIPEPERPVDPGPTLGAVEFDNVVFGYDPEQPVLRSVSFRVAAGERVAVVGATGAGKTTLLNLLTRLYDIQGGAIRLDGVDVREYGLSDLRRRIGIVPQDTFLFEGDILANIRLGQAGTSDAEAIAAADQLHLDEVVARFPGGYRAPVSERGKNLSAGEKQLIAFARVLAVAPPVLVLDEATSSVDSHTEHLLQEAVRTIMLGRTSLIIAHRLSTIRDVDRILVMHRGRLMEEGNHDQLLAKRGFYWRLHQLQYQENGALPEDC